METPTGGRAAIYTDNKVTIDSLKNRAIHGFLIEKNKEHDSTSSHAKLDDTLQVSKAAHRD